MRTIKLIYLLAIMLAPNLMAQDSNPAVFTLNECLDYAMENNAMVKNASIDNDIAKARVGETTAEGLPQINAMGGMNYNPTLRRSQFDLHNIDPNAPEGSIVPAAFGLNYDSDISIRLDQMVFDGAYFVGLKAARTYKDLVNKDYIKSKNDIVMAVKAAYYLAIVGQDRLELIETDLDRYRKLLDETTIMFENGFVEKIDVSRIQVLYNNTSIAFEQQKEMLRFSYDNLKYYMGYPVKQSIELSERISEMTFDYTLEPIDDFDYLNRIEFSQLMTSYELADLQRKLNNVQYLPTIDAFAAVGYTMATNQSSLIFDSSNPWYNYSTIGLTVNVPIFDGLRKSYVNQQNKLEIQKLDNIMIDTKNDIDLEIENARNELGIAIENLKKQKENMELAKEIYDVSEIKYQEGVGSNIEVIEAASAQKEAQTGYFNALYAALVAKIEQEKALGTLLNY